MSAEKLLEQLEKLRIDAKVLGKIRSQVAEQSQNSPQAVKPQAILKYLVAKGILTQSQSDQLWQNVVDSPPKSAPSEPDDIMDLIEGVNPIASETKKPEPVAPATKPPVTAAPEAKSEFPSRKSSDDRLKSEKDKRAKEKRDQEKRADRVPNEEPSPRTRAQAETVLDPDGLQEFNKFEPFSPQAANQFSQAELFETTSKLPTFKGKIDKRNQWATRWLYIASIILGLLVISGVVLALATIGMSAEEKFRIAMESFKRESYADAAKKLKEYYTDHPNHKEASNAKAYEAQSLILSHVQSQNFDEAIRVADAMLPAVIADPKAKIDELRDDIAVVLPRSLYQITEESKKSYKLEDLRKELERCQSLKQVIDNVEFIPTSQRNKPTTADYLTKIDDNIRAIQTQINKEEKYQVGLVEIKNLGDQLKTKEAFGIFRDLTRNFGDLAGREELRNAIREVSLKEQQLVKSVETNLKTFQDRRTNAISRSFVLFRPNGEPRDSLSDEVFSFLADGSVYAMRGSDGTILWRQFVGYQTEIQPAMFNDAQLLISDQLEFDLSLVDRLSGKLIWRLEIGEAFWAPSFNQAMILVTTRSGKILKLDPSTGAVIKAAQLPQPASVPALIAERESHIFQPGLHSNLYILSKDDLSCREVYYLGHEPGSIAVPPVLWSGYLVTAVNRGQGCDLWVFKPDSNGLNLELIQVMNVFAKGLVTTPISRLARWILVSSELGEIQILELLNSEKDLAAPVARFANELFENGGAKTFLLNEGNNVWIAGLELSRIKLQRAQTKLSRENIVNAGDLFVAPLQGADDFIFHVRRRKNSGMLSASLVDKMTLEQIWRVDFAGALPGSPTPTEGGMTVVSNQGDLFQINPDSPASVRPLALGSRTVESLKFAHVLPLGDNKLAVLGVEGQREMVYADAGQSILNSLATPADKPACRPLILENQLIIPSTEGAVVRIDPASGRMVGTPFLPPIVAGTKTTWFEPVWVRRGVFAIANGAGQGSESKLYIISAEDEKALEPIRSAAPPFPFKSQLACDGEKIFGAIEGAGADLLYIVKADDLSVAQQVELPGRVVAGPWLVGQHILVKLDSEKLVLFDKSAALLWDLSIPNVRFAGVPELTGDQILVSFQDGQILALDLASGKITRELSLRQPIAGPLVRIGASLYCSGLDGTVHEVDPGRNAGAN
jgi:outer membrane protein assembly factor BamB